MKNIKYILIISIISLHAFAQAPANWTVKSANFQYTMTMTLVANIDFAEFRDTADCVAAFVGTTCVGIAKPQYVTSLNRFISYLTVYGNSSGSVVNFMVYKNSANTVIGISKTLAFSINGNYGNLNAPYVL
ncbi:MAG: hypothetical protein NW207_02285 [Cytophagales bacterium]|nr:hypothetical protein [Cytophagales bacterium]